MTTRRVISKPAMFSLLLAALALAPSARADSLADRAPSDAIGFMSWAGSDALGKAYDGSHLKGLMDTMNLPQLIAQKIEAENAKQDDPATEADKKVGKDFMLSVVKAPSALYFGPIDFADADAPKFKVAFYSQVGAEKAKTLAAQIQPILDRDKKKEGEPPMTATAAGEFLLVTIGEVPGMDKRLAGAAPADGLSSVAAYQKAMKQVGGANAAAMMYMDGAAALKLLNEGIAAKGEMGGDMWPKIAEAMGLNSLRGVAFAGNFDGANWASQMFIGMDEKRFGYLALLDSKPLSPDVIKSIPKNAVTAGIMRFDAGRLMTDIRDGMAAADPQNGAKNVDTGLRQFFAVTGVDLQKDIIDNLDDTYVMYAAPDAAGKSFKNVTLVTKPKDAAKIDDSLSTIESMAATMMQRGPNGPAFKTDPMPAPNDKVIVHTISTPEVSPAWTVANGKLYFSMSPEAVQAAVLNEGKNGAITENAEFAELWKKLGNDKASAFNFVDYKKIVTEIYPFAEKALADYKADHAEDKNPFVLPPLEKITANLTPALSVNWTDADGYHTKSTGPLPVLDAIPAISIFELMAFGAVYQAKGEPAPAPEKMAP